MKKQDPDPAADPPVSEAALDAGLAIAFQRESGPPSSAGASALMALGEAGPEVRSVRLREPAGEAEPPLERPASPEMPPGHDPCERYQFQGEIARGGMGAVLRGHDRDLGRDVAVKVLLETHRGKPHLLHRFVEEAQIGGQLQHPGIVPVYELGQLADRRPYFTMKLVKGRTLARLLAERNQPGDDRPRFLKIFESACETVAYAHARGVIHRDLKPSNVMVGAFGEVQVMDWGLAKVLPEGGAADEGTSQPSSEPSVIRTVRSDSGSTSPDAGSRTDAGSVMGTPAYMPPEQALGEVDRLDERSDVFGLGAILCQILTGKPPYVAANNDAVRHKARQADLAECLARLDACAADPELIGLARRCLAPQAQDRPHNAGVLAAELARYRESVDQRMRQAEMARVEALVRAVEERKRRRVQLALAASLLLTVTVAAGAWLSIVQERAAREREALSQRAETERDVGLALGRAEQLRDQASRATAETLAAAEQNLALWRLATASLEQAEAALAAGDADRQTRQRVGSLRAELAQGTRNGEAACDVARLLADLDAARLARSDPADDQRVFNDPAGEAAFARAFSTFGLDVLRQPPEETANRLRLLDARSLAAAALGLDYWAACAADAATRARLQSVASAIDDDSWRRQFRKSQDRESLESLAAAPTTGELPATDLNLLADALLSAGAVPAALGLLEKASDLYPDDYWSHFRCAEQLRRTKGTEEETQGMLKHAWAAVTLRPRSPDAYHLLAWCLAQARDPKGATAALNRAIKLEPKFATASEHLDAKLDQVDASVKAADVPPAASAAPPAP